MSDFIVDVPPNEWMSANDRMHWADRSRRTKALRRRAVLLARSQRLLPVECPVLVIARIQYRTGGRADPANAEPTVKPILDGLTDAEIWPDDDSEHVVGPLYLREKGRTDRDGWHRVRLSFTNQYVPF